MNCMSYNFPSVHVLTRMQDKHTLCWPIYATLHQQFAGHACPCGLLMLYSLHVSCVRIWSYVIGMSEKGHYLVWTGHGSIAYS